MKLRIIPGYGWAFFALAAIATRAYGLNRGVYVGSEVFPYTPSGADKVWYEKDCRYLFPSGIHAQWVTVAPTPEGADKGFCTFFQPGAPCVNTARVLGHLTWTPVRGGSPIPQDSN